MHYLIVSFTHKNTNIATREKMAFNNNLSKEIFINEIIDCNYINSAILTCTCNRIEIIVNAKDIRKAINTILTALANKAKLELDYLEEIVNIYEDKNAVRHLFTVVSSLDSLVVGETQIIGQFKEAFRFAKDKEYLDQTLTGLVNYAFKCAKEVRNITTLGTGSVSVASASVAKAKQVLEKQAEIIALVIGAGEMSELTIKHLLRENFQVILMSRDIKKAELLANSIMPSKIDVQPYSNLKSNLNKYNLLFTATSSPYPIVTKDMVSATNFDRYWFDIAIPRDIETIAIPKLHIYTVDDLKDIVAQNLHLRSDQAKKAYAIIANMTQEYYEWLGSLDIEPLIKHIYNNANNVIEKKISNAVKKQFIKDSDTQNIKKLCQTIINELLHPQITELKASSKKNNNNKIINVAKRLYMQERIQIEQESVKCQQSLQKRINDEV